MIFFIFAMTISPSTYFTYSDIGEETKSYSASAYLTMDYNRNYFLFAYSHYLENNDFHQNLFSVGYTKEILPRISVRTVGFYVFNNRDNFSVTASFRFLYGYNPSLSVGYATSVYTKQIQHQKNLYSVSQVNPDFRFYIAGKIPLTFGVFYINAGDENYLAASTGFSVNVTEKLNLFLNGIYGNTFYQTNDRLLTLNNRPNLKKASVAVTAKYNLIKNFTIAGILQKDLYNTYDINYLVLGLEFLNL